MSKRQILEEEIDFYGYNIKVSRKKIKNINLTIRTDGNINLSVPFKLSEKELYKFLEDKKDWIRKSKSKFKPVIPLSYITGEVIEYLGIKYILNIIIAEKNQRIEINGEYLDIFIFEKNNFKEYLEKIVYDWYKSNLSYLVTDLTEIWANKLNLKVNDIKIRKMNRTWGSCNTKKKIITYSIELAKKDRSLIEYVVVHELAHLVHNNHGEEFKRLLDKLMPDWKIRKKALNNMRLV